MTPARKIAAGDVSQPRERPIIFSAPMVRALLAGRKTQTRRVLKPQPLGYPWFWDGDDVDPIPGWCDGYEIGRAPCGAAEREVNDPIKLAAVGDRLWVRETWKPHSTFAGVPPREIPPSKIFYAADDAYAPSGTPWRSPIHMPRWASRLTLAVTDVRVQRLQEINEADARAEGIRQEDTGGLWAADHGTIGETPRAAFAALWFSIHGPAAWDANPWVAAISFRVARPDAAAPAREDRT